MLCWRGRGGESECNNEEASPGGWKGLAGLKLADLQVERGGQHTIPES